ncbi:MAG: DNA topoisomerase IB [Patescibacteria group bacterium]
MVAQIHYHKNSKLSIRRNKKGSGFLYINKNGKPVSGARSSRISKLVIPPGWHDVLVSADPKNYIQAVGMDAKGRKQYIYHPLWVKKNQERKFDQMVDFGERLPTLREAVKANMRDRTLTRDRIVATIVWLLEHTFIRVGNKTYAKDNQSYGLTTMREKHVDIKGNKVTFSFEGKSGVFHELGVSHPKIAQTIRECMDIPGYELFTYFDEDKNKRVVDSSDVNEYLKTHTGMDFSAKDFRTWGGSVLAGDSLYKKGNATTETDLKKNITDVVAIVSTHLGNTKKVCRTYYIHPTIIKSYEENILVPHYARSYSRKSSGGISLTSEEYATWSLIKDS